MSDESFTEEDVPSPSVLTNPDALAVWAQFRRGDVVKCPRDTSQFALAVDAAAKSYRLICTHCGLSSPWFGTTPSGIVIRGTNEPVDFASGSSALEG